MLREVTILRSYIGLGSPWALVQLAGALIELNQLDEVPALLKRALDEATGEETLVRVLEACIGALEHRAVPIPTTEIREFVSRNLWEIRLVTDHTLPAGWEQGDETGSSSA